MKRGGRIHRDERGTVLLFMLGTLLFLLVFGGFAVDLAFLSTTRAELQRSIDAAALAGAGQLGFDDSVFSAVRQEASRFAGLNPARVGAINLDLNPANDPAGQIVLGIWDGAGFTPSVEGSQVNAVRCEYGTEIETSFLRILGFNTLPVAARAVALANPPANPPPNACVIPVGVTACAFADGGSFGSHGCGTMITFMTSSGEGNGPPPGTNNAAWINIEGPETPNAAYLRDAISAVAGSNCATSPLAAGQQVGTNNGLVQDVVDELEAAFVQNYNDPNYDPMNPITVTTPSGEVVYQGQGWDIYAAVIDHPECPPSAITGPHTVMTFTRFVMTQVINQGKCAVANNYPGNPWDPLCPPPNGSGTNVPPNAGAFRALFGYFSCGLSQGIPTTNPAPRAGLATGRRLVE